MRMDDDLKQLADAVQKARKDNQGFFRDKLD